MPASPLALAVLGHGAVDPDRPWMLADDEAVLRGRAAFETMRVYRGEPFRLQAHLRRMRGSAQELRLPAPDEDALVALSREAIAAAGVEDAALRLVWTPGRSGGDPNGFALVTPIPAGLEDERAAGTRLVSLQLAIGASSRQRSPWLLAGVKSTSYAVNIAAQEEARRRGADDAVFLSAEGMVLEGPISNVWFREGERLFTPSLELGILAGVTRDVVLEAAAAEGIEAGQGAYPLERMAAADEVFTSSSVRELMPVVGLDGAPVGDGRPGPMAARMQAALRAAA
ncbi:MAG: aminotransferase class IV, partial [Gaiellales bacterium]